MTSMTKIQCWCCGNPSGQHKMSCNIKSKVEGLVFMLNEIYLVPDETLETVITSCEVELLERRLAWYESEYVFEEKSE